MSVQPSCGGKPHNKRVTITAVEDDDETAEDIIPGPVNGPITSHHKDRSSGSNNSTSGHSRRSGLMGIIRSSKSNKHQHHHHRRSERSDPGVDSGVGGSSSKDEDDLQQSATGYHWAGEGILASRNDLNLSMEEFAAGCNLLQAAARGDTATMEQLLAQHPEHVNFRDYDRRTALHVAASEGHLHVCKMLMEKYHARVNRSDRWGGSPLDDAHRHRQKAVIQYLREKGATTGSGSRSTNLIQAAANGDYDEVKLLLTQIVDHTQSTTTNVSTSSRRQKDQPKLDLNKGDYDKRTALHLAYVVHQQRMTKQLGCPRQNSQCCSRTLSSYFIPAQCRRGARPNCSNSAREGRRSQCFGSMGSSTLGRCLGRKLSTMCEVAAKQWRHSRSQ